MSNSPRIAERQPTDTSSPMPVDVARDLLAVVRALEARVAVLEDLLASAIKPQYWIDQPPLMNVASKPDPFAPVPRPHYIPGLGMVLNGNLMGCQHGPVPVDPSDAARAALRLPTVPDAYGR